MWHLTLARARPPRSPRLVALSQPIRKHLAELKALKADATAADKAAIKADKEATQLQYGFALVDGHIEKMGNYTVEPVREGAGVTAAGVVAARAGPCGYNRAPCVDDARDGCTRHESLPPPPLLNARSRACSAGAGCTPRWARTRRA